MANRAPDAWSKRRSECTIMAERYNYDYADQDPTNIVDPSGTVACWVAHLFFKKCTPKVKKHHPTAQDWCNIGADLFYDFVGGRADADPDLPEIQSEWCEQPSGGSMTYA
jgi:hypothetical protein